MIRDALRRRRGDVDERLQASVEELSTLLAREERARAEFIGKVSHELRTPLTVIKGYVYTLHRGESDPAKAAKLDVINGECERLGYLIEDLLELSRARAGELRVHAEVFPLERCVSEVAERLQTVAEQGGVRVRLDWSCNGGLISGDQNRVRQIFANLITNGIKYAPPGTAVTVRGTRVRRHTPGRGGGWRARHRRGRPAVHLRRVLPDRATRARRRPGALRSRAS